MITTTKMEEQSQVDIPERIQQVRDALEVLHGRWKLPILLSLWMQPGRFSQILQAVEGITGKVLSKELKMLEVNRLISRKVYDSFPPMVEYNITKYGLSLEKVILEFRNWGSSYGTKFNRKDDAWG